MNINLDSFFICSIGFVLAIVRWCESASYVSLWSFWSIVVIFWLIFSFTLFSHFCLMMRLRSLRQFVIRLIHCGYFVVHFLFFLFCSIVLSFSSNVMAPPKSVCGSLDQLWLFCGHFTDVFFFVLTFVRRRDSAPYVIKIRAVRMNHIDEIGVGRIQSHFRSIPLEIRLSRIKTWRKKSGEWARVTKKPDCSTGPLARP